MSKNVDISYQQPPPLCKKCEIIIGKLSMDTIKCLISDIEGQIAFFDNKKRHFAVVKRHYGLKMPLCIWIVPRR